MQTLKFQIKGTTALIMHNIRLANPLDPIVQSIATITSKKPKDKTIEDLKQLAWLEFQGGLYWDEKIGPYIPGRVMHAVIVEAAKRQRKGAAIDRSLIVSEHKIKLEYSGPRDPEKMWAVTDKNGSCPYADVRSMKVGSARVQRCRPLFEPPWKAAFTVEFDENELNVEAVKSFVVVAGTVTGMMDDRPRGGRFETEEEE